MYGQKVWVGRRVRWAFPYMTPFIPDGEVKGATNQAIATDFWVSSIRVPFSIDQRRGEEQRAIRVGKFSSVSDNSLSEDSRTNRDMLRGEGEIMQRISFILRRPSLEGITPSS